MQDRRTITLGDVVRAWRERKAPDELRDDFLFVIYRLASWPLAVLGARMGLRPTPVTLTGALVALALPVIAWQGGGQAWLWLGLAGVLFNVLDGLDGDLARLVGGSPQGAWLDGQVDLVYRVALYLGVGIVAMRSAGDLMSPVWALGGMLLAACLALLARMANDATRRLREASGQGGAGATERQGLQPSPAEATGLPRTAWGWVYGLLASLDRMLPLLVLLAGAFDGLHALVIWILVYSALDHLSALAMAVPVVWARRVARGR